jgi:tRNA1Val (adenine37-N6)-methyltransferase
MRELVAKDETLDILCDEKLKIIQKKEGYRFSIDAILLANFIILKKHERLLDIGTGCGIIPIYMAKKGYTNSMLGVEIQEELFGLAVRNKQVNKCSNIDFMQGDITNRTGELKKTLFHVVSSNPPYTKADTGRKSPGLSRRIARYESSLDLPGLLSAASSLLYKKGRLYMVYPSRRLGELVHTAKLHKLEPKRFRFVYPRGGQPSNLMLAEFMKEGGTGTIVDKPFHVYRNGDYTEELQTYYSLKG